MGKHHKHDNGVLAKINHKLTRILVYIQALRWEIYNMGVNLDTLVAQITENTDVIDRAITFIHGLADQILAIKDDPVALAEFAATIKAADDKLAAAMVVEPPVKPPVEPPVEPTY